jgi:hypothetical protein
MYYLFFIISYAIISTISANVVKPKLCIDCKFFKNSFISGSQFGKCSLFPIVKENDYFLVNGKKNTKNIDYHYSSISRRYEDMCGKEGNFFKKKNGFFTNLLKGEKE